MEKKMNEKKIINVKLNLLKGFACIGVLFIHIRFPGLFGKIIAKASEYAVPIFFMIAGYYAFGQNKTVIKRRLIKIFKIFLFAYTLFFLYSVLSAIRNHELTSWFQQNFNWKTPVKYICFCTIDFAIPLWYFLAMIEVYLFWYTVVKTGKEHIVVKVFPVLFFLQVVSDTYCETLALSWFWKINFITRGMPWFLLGYYLNMDESKILRSIKPAKLVLISITGCIIAILPTAFSLPLKFSSLGYIPFSFGLFSLALYNPGKSICKPFEFIGEKLSLYIYLFQVFVGDAINFGFKHILKIDIENNKYLWCYPIFVLCATICIAWIVKVATQRYALPASTRADLLMQINQDTLPNAIGSSSDANITIRHGKSIITLPAGISMEAVADLVKALNSHF